MTNTRNRPAPSEEPQTVPAAAPPVNPPPAIASQATAIEQSRAVAEVQAAVVVAQQRPRSVQGALNEQDEVCRQPALAERAFFRYRRGDGQVSGPTIHLARELARIWGNVTYGTAELRRDTDRGESEVIAWAWDLQTNTRASTTFIVPHSRDTREGRRQLVDLRDVYENNANQGARRVRETIFAILPTWFVERGKELCSRTLQDGGGVPLPERIARARGWFADQYGITVEQLEDKLGRRADSWTPHDMAALSVIRSSLEQGETTVQEEFSTRRLTAKEIAQQAQHGAETPTGTDEPPPEVSDQTQPELAEEWPDVAEPGSGGEQA